MTMTDAELLYSATVRCPCGEGLAYPLDVAAAMRLRAWVCARALRGEVESADHAHYDFAFYKVREETSINNAGGHTTRPATTRAYTRGTAQCPKCEHTWESALYSACGAPHHWYSGPCPNCQYAVGAGGSHSSKDGPRIEVRYRDEVRAVAATP